jgi:hypothetical protein
MALLVDTGRARYYYYYYVTKDFALGLTPTGRLLTKLAPKAARAGLTASP